jgi:hypothetical protein
MFILRSKNGKDKEVPKMNSAVRNRTAVAFCLTVILIGCVAARPQVAIVDPPLIDQKEAKEMFIPKYTDAVVKADLGGFEYATAICRQIQKGEITLERVKSSKNERYHIYLFKEKESDASSPKGNYTIVALDFHPGSGLMRSCKEDGRCNVYVRNGFVRFGRTNVNVKGEPAVDEQGTTIKFTDDRFYTYDYLFSYGTGNKQEGDALISIFLSAFPVLGYE